MANIGAGETLNAYLVKSTDVNVVDAFVKDSVPTEEIVAYANLQPFRYRFLSTSEMTYQPLSAHLKGKYDGVLFTSETDIKPTERDKILFVDGILEDKYLRVTRVLPQVQIGTFAINRKYPNIIELA